MNNIELDLELEEEGGGRAEKKNKKKEQQQQKKIKKKKMEEEEQKKKKKNKKRSSSGKRRSRRWRRKGGQKKRKKNKNRNKKNNTKMFLVDSERNSFVRRNVDQTNYHLRNTATNCECGGIVRNDIFPDIPFHEMSLLFLFSVTGVLTSLPELC